MSNRVGFYGTAADPAGTRVSRVKTISGGAIGHFIEWYDWSIYGFLAGIFAGQMFPAGSATASLIAAYSAFALGFIGRPIGALVLSRYGKVAIVDIDVHHGNGTQFIFWQRPDVLTCSIHVDPRLSAPFYAGYTEEIGEGPGKGFNFNQPLPWATRDSVWLEALDRVLARVTEFAPGALVVPLGFDASEHDPVATFKISHDGFAAAGQKLAALKLPTVLVQEGGYLSPELGNCLRSFLRAFERTAA
jgi:hypothetical protein